MTLKAIADWVVAYPWVASWIAVLCLLLVIALTKATRGQKKFKLLRSAKEQAKFSPVQTTYNPRQYRKKR